MNQQMNVVGHKAKGMNPSAVPDDSVAQHPDQYVSVAADRKQSFAVVAAQRDVKKPAWDVNAARA